MSHSTQTKIDSITQMNSVLWRFFVNNAVLYLDGMGVGDLELNVTFLNVDSRLVLGMAHLKI